MGVAAFHHLLQTGSVLMIAVLALGLVFEHVSPGFRRDVLVGLLCGAFAALTVPVTLSADEAAVDGRVPLVLVAGLLGGPLAAVLSMPLPIVSALATGMAPALAGAAAVLVAGSLGAAVRLLCEALKIPPGRRMVSYAALASPATLAPYAVPELGLVEAAAALAPLAAWTAVATLVGGILAADELARGDMLREIRRTVRLRRDTGLVPVEALDGQVLHYWGLHERHGVDYAYLVVSIDDAPKLRDKLGPRGWDRLAARAGKTLRRSLRASDLCAAIDFDRFGILLPHASLAAALIVAARVRSSLGKDGISVSVGAADAEGTGGLADVQAAAEAALYAALAETPRGAIGPSPDAVQAALPRSFPAARADEPLPDVAYTTAAAHAAPGARRLL